MDFLQLNVNIRTKITYHIPVVSGALKYENKKLFSYSIYEKHKIRELRFATNEVVIYSFDENKNLTRIDVYDKRNKLIKETKIQLTEGDGHEMVLKAWTDGANTPNIGTIVKMDEDTSMLTFSRVNTFLGYKSKVSMIKNKEGLVGETVHFEAGNSKKHEVDKVLYALLYAYEMKTNSLDHIAAKILNQGWALNDEELEIIGTYSS